MMGGWKWGGGAFAPPCSAPSLATAFVASAPRFGAREHAAACAACAAWSGMDDYCLATVGSEREGVSVWVGDESGLLLRSRTRDLPLFVALIGGVEEILARACGRMRDKGLYNMLIQIALP